METLHTLQAYRCQAKRKKPSVTRYCFPDNLKCTSCVLFTHQNFPFYLAFQVFGSFFHGNALNPIMFPTLRKYETEVISMTAHMLHGDSRVVGAMTSGGTYYVLS